MEPTERPPEPAIEGEGTILTSLRAPRASEFARKQKLKTNPAVPGKRRYPPKTTHNPNTVTPSQRVSKYPDEPLTVSAGSCFVGLVGKKWG